MLFPSSSSLTHLGRGANRHRRNSHLQGIADRLEREAAMGLLRDSIPGHMWAYMLTLVVTPEELVGDPALAVRTARVAAARAGEAPRTDREVGRLRSVHELARHAGGDEYYPSRAHFEQGQNWLAMAARRYDCRD